MTRAHPGPDHIPRSSSLTRLGTAPVASGRSLHETISGFRPAAGWFRLLLWLLTPVIGPLFVLAQTDNFNDGDDAGWVRFGLQAAGLPPASYTFPSDGFGGKAYRISVGAPPVPDAGPARAFSYRTNLYSDFYVAADIGGWDKTLNQAFGFLARASNIGLGQTDGYALNYDPNQGAGGRGQLQINLVAAEQPTTLAAANITLDPAHRYRLVMTGAASTLTGQVYDFLDLTTPLITLQVDDATNPTGVLGLFCFSRVSAAETTDPVTGRADVTFDNYVASDSAPPTLGSQGTPHPISGMPQVVDRSPAALANFYLYTNGITFTATTLTTHAIKTNAVKLYLNGSDVSAGLALSGTVSNLAVAFSGLSPNTVYDARIVLTDLSGAGTTNEFNFDTFEEAYLDAPPVKVIEAEDYNYSGGGHQEDPPPSGLDSLGNPVNGNGTGYFNLSGLPGVDFFDWSGTPGSGATPDYRAADAVGTQAGSAAETEPGDLLNDTIREKYAVADLPEYEVRGTEGGEWLNYTRSFSNAAYRVYLRAAGRSSQPVYLDQVTGDPAQPNQATARLGVFNVPSSAMLTRYRYVPLTDTNGAPVSINLAGTNTLRLTLGGARTNVTQYTMVLNYLVFAPAVISQVVLESAPVAAGAYAADTTGVIDTAARTVTVPLNGGARFYRLRTAAPPALTIQGIRIVGADAVLTYQ